MSEGIPETTIFYDPASGYYGFSTRFPGQPSHHTLATFDTVDQALAWCDPHRERIWEETSDADETKLLVSRDFKEKTVGWCMTHLTLAQLRAVSATRKLLPQ